MKLIDLDALGIGMANPAMFENRAYADGWNSLFSILQHAPAVDAVPVVRCKDCVFRYDADCCPMCTDVLDEDGQLLYKSDATINDGFCFAGKKKDGGAEDEN